MSEILCNDNDQQKPAGFDTSEIGSTWGTQGIEQTDLDFSEDKWSVKGKGGGSLCRLVKPVVLMYLMLLVPECICKVLIVSSYWLQW